MFATTTIHTLIDETVEAVLERMKNERDADLAEIVSEECDSALQWDEDLAAAALYYDELQEIAADVIGDMAGDVQREVEKRLG